MRTIASTSLYYAEGSSNKEYHAELVEVEGGNVVNFRYGRRGGALSSGTKTSTPVDFAQAKKIFDKLIQSKSAKGYTPDVSGVAYQGTERAGLKSDFSPQLLNPISEEEAQLLLNDNQWAAQEKMDGERRAAHADGGGVFGLNRKGLVVPLPQAMADELKRLADSQGAIRLDGEIIGDVLYVFDMHIHRAIRLHQEPWIKRMELAAKDIAECKFLKPVPVAFTSSDKRNLWDCVRFAHGEGVVLKRLDSVVTAGRPNSGGDWLKFKFKASASCSVLKANAGKRSVQVGLQDGAGQPMIPFGNVTIPPSHDIPEAGDVVEVEYLYAYPNGSLYQPVYRGKRSDLDAVACSTAQLKYKPEDRDNDEA
jgi:bifunctional non-homologous end joining protein LigD